VGEWGGGRGREGRGRKEMELSRTAASGLFFLCGSPEARVCKDGGDSGVSNADWLRNGERGDSVTEFRLFLPALARCYFFTRSFIYTLTESHVRWVVYRECYGSKQKMALPLTHPHHLLFPPTPPTTLPLQIKNTNAKATTLHYSIPTEYPQFKIDACPQKGIHLIAGATVTLRITYLGTRKDDSIGNTSLAQNIQSIKDATNMIRSGILPPISNKAVTGKESESQSKTALIIASPYISLNGVAVALEIAPPTRQIVTINQINFSAIIPQTCTKTIPLKNVGGQTVNWALWTVKPIKCEPSQVSVAVQ